MSIFGFTKEVPVPTVENVSRFCIEKGFHKTNYHGSVLISINDPGMEPPKNSNKFTCCFPFYFLDAEKPIDGDPDGDFLISDYDAHRIAEIIEMCYSQNINIIVHCSAGVCRSGAVAECAEAYGFEYIGNHKQPNLLVKKMVMNKLYGDLCEKQLTQQK